MLINIVTILINIRKKGTILGKVDNEDEANTIEYKTITIIEKLLLKKTI